MTKEEIRHLIETYYPSETWKARVAKMSDQQVFNIYQRLRNEKKIKE